ncbi:hypothetical protein B0H14DRAFT_3054786 [Mycena olivaceomarginata]|nr:hypothetical protein B0H14DRAFT_3054786 [Mycena olivaceomarginata]
MASQSLQRSTDHNPSSMTINQVHAVLLPTEILVDIFIICLPVPSRLWTNIIDGGHPLRPAEVPLLVAGVCRRWREVAISTPRLWLPLHIPVNRKTDLNGPQVLSTWLSRSHPHPLSFTMHRLPCKADVEELIRHCERDPHVFDEVRGRLPNLSKLCLDFEAEDPFVVESFAVAPQLKEVHLIAGSGSVVLPWHQLTNLTCQYFTDIECVNILRQCSALVECRLISFDTDPSHYVLQNPRNSNTYALRFLELPSLRVLELELESTHVEGDVEILLEHICLWEATDQDLLRCIPFLASLVSLEIRTYHDFLTDDILRSFTNRAVFPKLQKLDFDVSLQDWRTHDWTEGLMREMILSRCLCSGNSTDVRLQTFRLVYKPDDDEDDTGLMPLASELGPPLPIQWWIHGVPAVSVPE